MKVKNYSTFWWILGIYGVLVPLTFIGLSGVDVPFWPSKSEIFSFPKVWNYITWTASWWNVLLGVLIVILVCNDIAFKTQRQSVIEGLTRRDVILGKLYFLIVLSIIIGLYTFLIGAIMGCIYSTPANLFSGIEFLGIYIVQTFGYFAFAFFFGVLVRKPALSIILFVVIIMVDGVLKWPFLMNWTAQFIPTIAISDLTPFPFFSELLEFESNQDSDFEKPFMMSQLTRSLLAVVYSLGFVLVGYLSLKRRDL